MSLTPSDKIASLALFVAICTFVGSVIQTYLTRKHNRLSVRPRIDWTSDRVVNKPVTLSIHNQGLGPAVLDSLHIRFNGEEYLIDKYGMPVELHEALIKVSPIIECHMPGPRSTLTADSSVSLITCHGSVQSYAAHNNAVSLIRAIGFRLEYSSMYGEKFSETREPEDN